MGVPARAGARLTRLGAARVRIARRAPVRWAWERPPSHSTAGAARGGASARITPASSSSSKRRSEKGGLATRRGSGGARARTRAARGRQRRGGCGKGSISARMVGTPTWHTCWVMRTVCAARPRFDAAGRGKRHNGVSEAGALRLRTQNKLGAAPPNPRSPLRGGASARITPASSSSSSKGRSEKGGKAGDATRHAVRGDARSAARAQLQLLQQLLLLLAHRAAARRATAGASHLQRHRTWCAQVT